MEKENNLNINSAENLAIEERVKSVKKFFKKNNLLIYIVLALILLLAWQIRTANVSGLKDVATGGYQLGPDLDPFLFLYIINMRNAANIFTQNYSQLRLSTFHGLGSN